jgi:long-chain acyl-CoA synthetase
VASIANWLHAHGVKRGDRVAIAMRNFPEWMLIYWACVSVGVTVVGMNAWWTAEEMSYGFKDAQPKVAFVDPERMARIAERPEMIKGISLVAVRAPSTAGYVAWSDVIATGGTMPVAEIDPDDDACIFYTSGTTGFPKGAQLTHRGCVANLFNMMFSGQAQALATQRATGVAPDPNAPVPVPIALLTTPLFHVTANNCGAYATTAAGGTIVLMYKWDAGEALRIIEAEKVTSMSGVPTMAREVLTHPDFASRDTSSLLSLGGGGAQVPPDLVHKIDAQVKTARPNTGYGMTETCGIITAIAADFFVDRPDSAGPAMPAFEARCVDDDGNTVPLGRRDHHGRLAAYRRHRPHGRGRLHLHRRPQEGHGAPRRRERLLRRGGGQPLPASGRRRMFGLRSPRRTTGRGGRGRHRASAWSLGHARRAPRALRLHRRQAQDAAVHLDP